MFYSNLKKDHDPTDWAPWLGLVYCASLPEHYVLKLLSPRLRTPG